MGILDAPGVSKKYVDIPNLKGNKYLRTFNVALAKRDASPIDIVMMGDSKTDGTGASAPNTRWINRFLDKYRAAYQPSGVKGGFGYVPGQYVTSSFTQPWTLAGGAVYAGTAGLGKRCITMTAAGHTATITVGPATVYGGITGFDICTYRSSGQGTFSVAVDGGTAVNQVGTGLPSQDLVRYAIRSLDPTASHTIVVSWVSSGSVLLDGIMLYNGDESLGIRMWDGSHHGIKASQYSSLSDIWWTGFTNIQPSLVYYQLGRNDFSGGDTVANIVTNVTAQIGKIRSMCTIAPSIIYGMDWQDLAAAPVDTYANWRTAMQQVALTDGNIAFFDLFDLIGSIQGSGDNALGITLTDYIHASPTVGHPLMADAFFSYLNSMTGKDTVRKTGDTMSGALNMGSNKIVSLGTPTAAADAATKGYVDGLVVGGGSGITRNVQTLTTTATIGGAALTDYVVFIGASGAPTLPTAVGNTNRYVLKNIDTTNKTVATTSSQTIDGSTTINLTPNASVDAISDGANWRLV